MHGQALLKFKLSNTMGGRKVKDLLGFSHTTISRGMARKYPVSGSSVGERSRENDQTD